jgi:hypothetical protein
VLNQERRKAGRKDPKEVARARVEIDADTHRHQDRGENPQMRRDAGCKDAARFQQRRSDDRKAQERTATQGQQYHEHASKACHAGHEISVRELVERKRQ